MTPRLGVPSGLRSTCVGAWLSIAAVSLAGAPAAASDGVSAPGPASDAGAPACPFPETPGAPGVQGVSFQPESYYLDAEALASVAEAARGCALGAPGRRALAEAVNALYAERDVALAFATVPEPPADPRRPVVELTEVRYGDVVIQGAQDTSDAFLRQRIGDLAGRIADLETLQERLEALAELEGLLVQADLAPGDAAGQTDLTLSVQEEPEPWTRIFSVSNDGSESTGTYEASATLIRRSLTGHRDPLTFSATGSEGARSVLAGYSRPFGAVGVRLSNTLGVEWTEVIDETSSLEGLQIETLTWTSAATLPLYATREGNASLSLEAVPFRENIEFQEVRLFDQRGVEVAVGGQMLIRFPGTGAVAFAPKLARGTYRERVFDTSENYTRVAGSAQGFAQVFERVGLLGEVAWQVSDAPVPSNFAFDVTGRQSVRGYPTEALSSDEGFTTRVTVEDTQGFALPVEDGGEPRLAPYAFVDTGAGWDEDVDGQNEGKLLASVGIGANLTFDLGAAAANLDLSIGFPLVSLPGIAEAGDPEVFAQFRLTF